MAKERRERMLEKNGDTQGDAAQIVLHTMMLEGVIAEDPAALDILKTWVDAYQRMMEMV